MATKIVTVSLPEELYMQIKTVLWANGESLSGFVRKNIISRLQGDKRE